MRKMFCFVLLLIGTICASAQNGQQASRFTSGSSLPTTCTFGQVYALNTTNTIYICTVLNTWQGLAGAAQGTLTVTSNSTTLATAGAIQSNAVLNLNSAAATTLNVSGLVAGASFTVVLNQDDTGGDVLTLGTGCTWKLLTNSGLTVTSTITPSTIPDGTNILTAQYDGTNCNGRMSGNYAPALTDLDALVTEMWNDLAQVNESLGNSMNPPTLTDSPSVTLATAGAPMSAFILPLSSSLQSRTVNVTGLVSGARFALQITPTPKIQQTITMGTGCTWKLIPEQSGLMTLPSLMIWDNSSSPALIIGTYDGTNCWLIAAR